MMLKKRNEDTKTLIDKSTVLLEARAFNESPLNVIKCREIIAKLLFLLHQGTTLNPTEATNLFFSITKLFMSPSVPLRQVIYLAIKELSTVANDVLMATSSLTKDMNGKSDVIYRANAIRALVSITGKFHSFFPNEIHPLSRGLNDSLSRLWSTRSLQSLLQP